MALFLFAFLEDLVPFLNVWWLGNSRTAGVQVQITCTYSNICFGIKYNCMKKMSKTGFLKNIQMQIYIIQIFAYLMYFLGIKILFLNLQIWEYISHFLHRNKVQWNFFFSQGSTHVLLHTTIFILMYLYLFFCGRGKI